jgi:ribonuclease BN (tRNA processing enzyme)
MASTSGKEIGTRVVLLGTGTPNAEPERSGPSLGVVSGEEALLVDCGPGVVRRAAAACQQGIAALAAPRLRRVFLTHLHSDHTAGLPDLLLTPWVLERTDPLEVFGPPGTAAMVEHVARAYEQDIRQRLEGLEPANDSGWRAVATEIAAGTLHRAGRFAVDAFRVDHGAWEAYGYRIRTADRTIVVSGDTAPSEELAEKSRGCDLLVHEVYSVAGFQRLDRDWQQYHSRMHTSAHELARLATRIEPGLLVLCHQLHWGTSDADLLAEVRGIYGGPVVSGRDLSVY